MSFIGGIDPNDLVKKCHHLYQNHGDHYTIVNVADVIRMVIKLKKRFRKSEEKRQNYGIFNITQIERHS